VTSKYYIDEEMLFET